MVSWWGCVKGGWWRETSERKKKWAGTRWWDGILGDFWRSWSATSSPLPPIPPNHNKGTSLIEINKLILLQFAHTRTCTTGIWTCKHLGTYTHGGKNWFIQAHTHTQLLHTNVDGAYPQFIRHKHSAAIIVSDAWLLLLFESLWHGTSSAWYFVCDFFLCIHVKLNNWSDTSHCMVDFDYLCSVF